ncbi:MAG: translocation/assembly module TamB domain-containing protein, partial [Oligoflexia bacterium]|nr:translocation/assembly module TamB domain-containing protein [Oligoflexia bacterium]
EIVLSKLNIDGGDIFLRTVKKFKTSVDNSKNIKLPINKVSIQNTNINLQHKNYSLKFSDIQSEILQTSGRVFNFNLKIQSFYFNKDLGFEDFLNINSNKTDKNEVYQLFMEGVVQKNRVSFSQVTLKNDFFTSLTQSLEIGFDAKSLTHLSVVSSGSLPFSLIQEGLSLINKGFQLSGSNLSYDLNAQYTKNKGYRGAFSLLSKDLVFRSEKLKSIDLKGRLNNKFLFLNKGSIQTENRGDIYIKNMEWGFLEESLPFGISVKVDHLSSDFISYAILDTPYIPVKGNLTGLVTCQGRGQNVEYLKCHLKGKGEKIIIQLQNQTAIFSLYDFNLDSVLEWSDQQLAFEVSGKKEPSVQMNVKGRYSEPLDEFSASYSFSGELNRDLWLNTPFLLTGKTQLSNGKVFIKNNQAQLSGQLSSPSLNIDAYQLENISSLYKLKGDKFSFFNIKGRPGKTSYSAEMSIDFSKEELNVQLASNFFDIQDLLKAVKNKITFPVDFKGSGAISFFIHWPWKQNNKREFQLQGDFFNVFIGPDFFSQSTFDIRFKNQQGVVQSLLFRKGAGLIEGAGFFDENYKLSLTMNGQKLSLESMEFLNDILPLNQAGDISFNLDLQGALNNPNITGSAFLSNTFLYSYPVKDSRLELKINKNSFSFSGNIIDEIKIDQFIYPFSKRSNFKIKGRFNNLDFIKILLSKNKKDKVQNYTSQIKGSFDIEKINNTFWKGISVIDDVLISKSDQWLKSKSPFSILLKKNKWALTSPIEFSDYNNKTVRIKKTEQEQLLLNGSAGLGWFSVIVPFFEEFDGDIKGQVLLNNNLKQLNPKGSLHLEKGLLAIYPLPNFTNVSAQLVFANNNIIINDFSSRAGGGFVKGIGAVFYDFMSAPVLNLNLSFNKVHFQIPEGFNTKGNGKIKIKGSAPPYLISGEYNIDSGSIIREFSSPNQNKKYDFALLEKKEEKKKSIFEIDLNLKTKQAVSINSSLIRSSIEGQTNIYGPFNSLLMKGNFELSKNLKQSFIFFRGQEFKINSGSISFKNSSPANPYLDISADTVFKEQVIDPLESQEKIEKQYKIFLSVKGYSQDLDFSLKSSPVLNEREIISLLTLGISSRRFDAKVKQNITDVDYYPYQILTSLLIEKSLNKEIKDTLGLDFRLTPYINTLNKPVTKITLSKNWFDKWKTSFSRTIEESAYSVIRLNYDLIEKNSLSAFLENRGQVELEETE